MWKQLFVIVDWQALLPFIQTCEHESAELKEEKQYANLSSVTAVTGYSRVMWKS